VRRRSAAPLLLVLAVGSGCDPAVTAVWVEPPRGLPDDAVYEIALREGSQCPEDGAIAERALGGGALDRLFLRAGETSPPSTPDAWTVSGARHVVARALDGDCRVIAVGCVALDRIEPELSVPLRAIAGAGCPAEHVCGAGRCTPWPEPEAGPVDPSSRVAVCGFAPGSWRLGPAAPVAPFGGPGVEWRRPTASVSPRWGLERFAARRHPERDDFDPWRLAGETAREMAFEVANPDFDELRLAPVPGSEIALLDRRPPGEPVFVGRFLRSEDGRGIGGDGDFMDFTLDPDRAPAADPFPLPVEPDGSATIWHASDPTETGDWDIAVRRLPDVVDGEDGQRGVEDLSAVNCPSAAERSPAVNRNEHLLLFSSNRRPDGCEIGARERIYVAFRSGTRYSPPYELALDGFDGAALADPFLHESDAECALYFVSDRDTGTPDVFRAPIEAR